MYKLGKLYADFNSVYSTLRLRFSIMVGYIVSQFMTTVYNSYLVCTLTALNAVFGHNVF